MIATVIISLIAIHANGFIHWCQWGHGDHWGRGEPKIGSDRVAVFSHWLNEIGRYWDEDFTEGAKCWVGDGDLFGLLCPGIGGGIDFVTGSKADWDVDLIAGSISKSMAVWWKHNGCRTSFWALGYYICIKPWLIAGSFQRSRGGAQCYSFRGVFFFGGLALLSGLIFQNSSSWEDAQMANSGVWLAGGDANANAIGVEMHKISTATQALNPMQIMNTQSMEIMLAELQA